MNKAQRIKHARTHPRTRERKFTLDEIAAACGISRAAVNQWEIDTPGRGTSPKEENLEVIADLTGYDYTWLRTGEEPSTTTDPYSSIPPHMRRLLINFEALTAKEQRAVLELVNSMAESKMVEAPPEKKATRDKKTA